MADKKKKETRPAATPAELKPFTTTDMAEAYRHFLPLAEQVPDDAVSVRRGDVVLARLNIDRGVEAIQPHIATIRRRLPEISVTELLELPALALALVHADGRVPRTGSTGEIDAALARVSTLRDLTLRYLEVAAGLGLVPEGRVRAIRAGKGKIDNARDCVDIAGMFREFAQALAGKHPFTPETIQELATTGTWLVQAMTPRGGTRAPAGRDPAALIRDRFWALIDERHDNLRTAGVALFGIKQVDEHVPPLLSRTVARSAEPEPAPTPEQGPS